MKIAAAVLCGLVCVSLQATSVVDGVLDDEVWASAVWHDDFTQVNPSGGEETSPGLRFALVADEAFVHIAFSVGGSADDSQAEVYLAPDGTPNDFYRFVVRRSDGGEAYFYSEAGAIQPDPYAPAWQHAVVAADSGWTAEIAIPLSAFYMTKTATWKNTWRVNVVSSRRGADAFSSWSPVTSLKQSSAFRTLDGFPDRPAGDDVRVSAVSATIDDVRATDVSGRLAFTVTLAVGGEFDIAVSSAETVRKTLVAGDNKLSVPCTYPDRGRHDTHFALTRVSTGHVAERDYPVQVDFSTVDMKFSSPGYRANFYPGQDASRIAGTVRLLRGGTGRLTLSGPGFATQTADVASEDVFSFDTTGFTVGTAALEVVSGVETNTFLVRRLAATGSLMTWIENGCLVTNGVPVIRRGIYAEGYMQGERFTQKLADDRPSFRMTDAISGVEMSMGRLISGIEDVEGKQDVRPCAELYAAMDAKIEANRGKDFGYYYINDEPECRSVSPVYLKYVYDYIAGKDPYHVIAMASRGGLTYINCADLFETHPYLNCHTLASGERGYGRAPNEIGDFVSAFEPEKRLDKCVGFLPTAFAYRGQSIANDYPTFDEYELHCWAAGVRGARTLWPYAGHDLDDRAGVYEGCRYTFQSFEALQDYLLLGSRTNFVQNSSIEGALWTHGAKKLLVVCNFTARQQSVPFGECVDGTFRAFRGTRLYSFAHGVPSEPVVLEPLETLVAITDDCDAGLDTRAEVVARVTAGETARTTRDNRLLEEYKGIVFTSNMDGMGCYKLIDGTQDVLCRYSNWRTNAFVQMAFTTFTPAFSKVRVYGKGLDTMVVDIRKGGEWRRLTPVAVRTEKWMRELDFGVTNTTVKMRITFPGPSGKKNYCELYEIELPRAGEDGGSGGGGTEVAEDEGVSLRWDAADCPMSDSSYTTKAWYGPKPVSEAISTNADGTFSIFTKTSGISRFMPFTAADKWLVLDFASFEDLPGNLYRQWSVYLWDFDPQCHGGTVTHPQAGIYVIPLQENHPTGKHLFRFYNYGLRTTFNHISLMERPANRIEAEELTGARLYRPKGRMRLTVTLAAPCEDLEVEMLKSYSTGDLKPFRINGASVLEMRCADGGTGRVWRTEFDIVSCESGGIHGVYAKASVLGGALKRPLFTNFTKGFSSEPLTDYIVREAGVRTLSAPCEYLLLSNAVSGAGVKFDQASLGDEKHTPASALRFTGFDAGAGALTTFGGGWWDFGGGDFCLTNATVGGRVTTIEGSATVTNLGLVAVAGKTGSDNALHVTDAARLYAGKVVLGRSTAGGQRSRLTVTGGALLSVTGAVGMSEGPTRSSSQLTGNLLRVADSNSLLRIGGSLTLGRQFSKAEAPGSDGYYGSVGGNTFELTDGARAEIGGALALDSSCRHGTSNRVVVSKGAWLKVNGVKLGNAWSSITSVKDHYRLEILDGAVVTNTGEFLVGQYQNGNRTPMSVLVSNAVFHTDQPISHFGGLIKSPDSEIVVSGPRAVFRPGPFYSSKGDFQSDRYLFGCYAKGSRIVIEDGADVELPLTCGYSYTVNSCQNTVLVRSGATIRSTNIGMAGYGGGKDENLGVSNRFVVADGSVVTSGIFRANSRWGVVSVEDARLVLTNDYCYDAWGGLMLGCPNGGSYASGTNVVLELRGRRPAVRIPYGRLRAELASRIRFILPADGFAEPSEPLVYVNDLCLFDAATDCGVDIVGAEAFYDYHKQALGRGGRYVLIDALTNTLSDASLAATQATLPEGVSLTCETAESGRMALVLTVSPRAGEGGDGVFNGVVADVDDDGAADGPKLHVVLGGVVRSLPLAGDWTNFLGGAALMPATFNATGRNGIPVWQSYVFGVNPFEDKLVSEQFKALIEIGADGKPIVTCSPDQSENDAVKDFVTYTTLGKPTIAAEPDWEPVTDENADAMRFFKVRAEIRQQGD